MSRAKILVDSNYWISLYSPREMSNHQRAIQLTDILENNDVLLPWPTLYEFINTRLAKRKESLYSFEQFLLKPNVQTIHDDIYKDKAIKNIFLLNLTKEYSISLVDEVIRQMIVDPQLKIDFLLTLNKGDFQYPCQIGNVLIIE